MDFHKKVLDNGMTVLMEKRNLPVMSFSITNRFGGAYETSMTKGIAHFIEHLVFTGTKTRSHEEISREIEKRGGILNAFTANEVTSFFFTLPSRHLMAGIDIIADILNNPKFDSEKFEKEKKVVLEEMKMYHDNPMTDIYNKIHGNLYEKPFGEGIIGSAESVSALKRDFVYNHFRESYNPKNFIAAAVGNGDFDEICDYLESNFRPSAKTPEIVKISKRNSESVEERKGIDQSHFMFSFHTPLPSDKSYYDLKVLDAYLARGMSSKLFLEIREKRGLAYAVKSSIQAENNYSNYGIYTGTTRKAIPEIKKIILKEFEKVRKMTEKDLKKAKEMLIGLREISSEKSSDVMSSLMLEELTGDAKKYYKYNDNINSVTLDKVKEIAKLSEYSTAAIVPK